MSLKILVNNSYIELEADSIVVPLTFSVADMKQPDKRKTSSSKTIVLKGTQTNLNVLRNVYSLPMSNLDTPLVFSFDPRTRIEAIYEENGIVIFDGLFQVLKAVRVGEVFEFECLLFSNIANVISTLGDLKLIDLNFSEYQHLLGQTVARNSWDTSVVVNGTPTTNFTGGIPDGFGYVYGWMDMGFDYPTGTALSQRTSDLTLGVYFKELLSKMMQHIGQPYTFTLDNTELWKRLTLFNEGGQIAQVSQDDLDLREVDFSQTLPVISDSFTNIGNETLYPFLVNVINQDDLDQIEGLDVVIANTGNYLFSFSGDFDYNLFGFTGSAIFTVELLVNGVLNTIVFEQQVPISPSLDLINIAYSSSIELQMEAGDVVVVRLKIVNQNALAIIIENGVFTTTMTGIDSPLLDGDTVYITRFLPKMKCADFYKSIMRMFNLYQQDQEDGILIIPAIDYYQGSNSNETEDWSDKLDYSQPIEIEPPNRIEGKNYVFKYATETDAYHNEYLKEFGLNYGDFNYTVPNTWQVGDNVLGVGFALGVPAQIGSSNVVMPSIFVLDNGLIKPYKGKAPRVYVYNGLRNIPDTCSVRTSSGTSPITIQVGSQNKYPEFHHMLNPAAPTFEIAFQAPQRLYYTGGSITNSNLFNTYWDRFIREITSADAKILTAYFKLSRMDIYNLNFRSLKNIDGVVYRLNIVSDYMGSEQTTKCELIKIIEGQSRRVRVQVSNPILNQLSPISNPIITIDSDTPKEALRAGQMGYDKEIGVLYINTGDSIIEIRG